jgi:hypothetical protein
LRDGDLDLALGLFWRESEVVRHATRLESACDEEVRERGRRSACAIARPRPRELLRELAESAAMIGRGFDGLLHR